MHKNLFFSSISSKDVYVITVGISDDGSYIGYSSDINSGISLGVFGSITPSRFMDADIYYLASNQSKTEIWTQSDLNELKITRLDTNNSCVFQEDDKDPGQYTASDIQFFTNEDLNKKIRLTIEVYS